MNTIKLKKNALFNPEGDTDLRHRRMIGGNTTNLNDFNNMRYKWVSDWYRQAMNNFWIPEEINLTQDTKDYPHLDQAERTAYDKILSFLVFLILYKAIICPPSANTSQPMKLIYASISKPFRNVYTAKATVTCWILSVAPKSVTRSFTNGRQTDTC